MNDPRLETVWQQDNLGPWKGRVTITRTRVDRGRHTSTPSDHLTLVNATWTGPPAQGAAASPGPVHAAACVTAATVEDAVPIARQAAEDLQRGRVPRLRRRTPR